MLNEIFWKFYTISPLIYHICNWIKLVYNDHTQRVAILNHFLLQKRKILTFSKTI